MNSLNASPSPSVIYGSSTLIAHGKPLSQVLPANLSTHNCLRIIFNLARNGAGYRGVQISYLDAAPLRELEQSILCGTEHCVTEPITLNISVCPTSYCCRRCCLIYGFSLRLIKTRFNCRGTFCLSINSLPKPSFRRWSQANLKTT